MILEEHNFLKKLSETELPVILPLEFQSKTLHNYENINYAIFPKIGGRATSDLNKNSWLKIGRLLGRLHLVGENLKDSNRIVWTPEHATKKSLNYLLNNKFIPKANIPGLETIMSFFWNNANTLFTGEPLFPIHGDCHLGNLIHRPGEGM